MDVSATLVSGARLLLCDGELQRAWEGVFKSSDGIFQMKKIMGQSERNFINPLILILQNLKSVNYRVIYLFL